MRRALQVELLSSSCRLGLAKYRQLSTCNQRTKSYDCVHSLTQTESTSGHTKLGMPMEETRPKIQMYNKHFIVQIGGF